VANYLAVGIGPSDPSAGLVQQSRLVAFVEEERLTRSKHATGAYPIHAIRRVLEMADLQLADIDGLVVGWDLEAYSDGRMEQFFGDMRAEYPVDDRTRNWQDHCLQWLSQSGQTKFHYEPLADHFGSESLPPVLGAPHHQAHAFAAARDSGFDESLVVSLDGSGDHLCTTISFWDGRDLETLLEIPIPHSLGWFYAALTEYLGFSTYDGEHKVMGLAPLGKAGPLHEELEAIVPREAEGPAYTLDPTYIHYGPHTYSGRFTDDLVDLLGRPPRRREEPLDEFHADIAYSAQSILEDRVLALAHWGLQRTGATRICFGGGVAHNVAMIGRVARDCGLDAVYAHPLAGDVGVAVGAALYLEAQDGRIETTGRLRSLALGPMVGAPTTLDALEEAGLVPTWVDDDYAEVAAVIAEGGLVAWCQGRMEAGPRALGHRSILGDPRTVATRDKLNSVVKDRYSWQPFAPAIRVEDAGRYLIDASLCSLYMTYVAEASEELARVAPAVVHVDGTVRVQLVDSTISPDFHALITSFGECTGVPVLLNTSLNRAGEPIACSERDAVVIFQATELDVLVIDQHMVTKGRP